MTRKAEKNVKTVALEMDEVKQALTEQKDYLVPMVQQAMQSVLEMEMDRSGHFSTQVFEQYQRSEKALVAALAQMYVQGVSTRKVAAITEELCGHEFSASSISEITLG